MSLANLTMLNLVYEDDTGSFNDLTTEGSMACSSLLVRSKGRIIHGRTMEYFHNQALMRQMSIFVNFVQGGKIVYSGFTFAFYVGIFTGQRPNAFTVSLNLKRRTVASANLYLNPLPDAYAIRKALERNATFAAAVGYLRQVALIAPAYLIIGGLANGTIIDKDIHDAVLFSMVENSGSAIVFPQSSYTLSSYYLAVRNVGVYSEKIKPVLDQDHSEWKIKDALKEYNEDNITADALFALMLRDDILQRKHAIFTVVMSAANPRLLEEKKHYTLNH